MDIEILKEELQYFEHMKPELLKTHPGQYALIKGQTLAGTFTTFQEAYEAGISTFGNEPFLIKQIIEKEMPQKLPALTHSLLHANF